MAQKKNGTVVESSNETNIKRTFLSPAEALNRVSRRTCDNTGGRNLDDFRNLEIADAVFCGEDLSRSKFDFSKLVNVRFVECDISGCSFNFGELENVHFERCSGDNMSFHYGAFADCSFRSMSMNRSEFDFARGTASFESCQMENCEFHSVRINIDFMLCNLARSEFTGALTIAANESNFAHVELNDSVLSGILENCNCEDAEFIGSNCIELKIKGGSLRDLSTLNAIGFSADNGEVEDEDLSDEQLEKIFQ